MPEPMLSRSDASLFMGGFLGLGVRGSGVLGLGVYGLGFRGLGFMFWVLQVDGITTVKTS